MAQAPQPPGRVVQPGLALIGEIEVAIAREMQIVEPLEALAMRPVEKHFDLARVGVEQHQPLFVIGDEDASVAVDFEAVRLAVIGRDQGEFAARRNLEESVRRGYW